MQQCLNLLEGLPVYNRIMSFAGIEHIFLTAVLRLLERNGGVSICLLISAVTHVTLIGENIGYLCGSPLLFAELGLDAFFGQIPCYFTGRPSTQILLEDVAYYIGFPVKGFELLVLQSEPIWGVAVNIFASFHPLYDGEPLVL